MLKKILMAAGLAAAFSLSAQVAEAKVKVHDRHLASRADIATIITILSVAAAMVIIPVPGYFVPHPGYDYGDDYGYRDRVSCKEARWIVRERGFRDVRTADCGGKFHTFIRPGKRAEFSGLKFTQEMAGSIPSGQFDARM